MLAPDPAVTIDEHSTDLRPPLGFRPLVHTPVGLETLAKGLLSESYGTRALFRADGYAYQARIEPHPPAPERGLPNWHKGVTIYEAVEAKGMGSIYGLMVLLLLGSLAGFTLGAIAK
jgi:hypothetical protein